MMRWFDRIVGVLTFIGVIVFFSLLLWFLSDIQAQRQAVCNQYGEGWYYVEGDRSPDLCSNDKGEVRYPKEFTALQQ